MSADLRALLHDLAAGAPPIDNRIALADTAYTAGRRRRRVRHLEMSAAAAIVVIAALFAGLFLGPSPLAAKYGASSSSKATGYPTHIGRQWPVLDLPAKPGPIAGLLQNDDETWYAVSPSGHRWSLPFLTLADGQYATAPVLSADGRLLGYTSSHNTYVVRNLVTGRSTSFAHFVHGGIWTTQSPYLIDPYLPGYFSVDDRYLALQGMTAKSSADIFVLDLATGQVLLWPSAAYEGNVLVGWTTDDQLRLVDLGLGGKPKVTIRGVDGRTRATLTLQPPSGSFDTDDYAWTTVLTPDRNHLVVVQGGAVLQLDLATGAPDGGPYPVPVVAANCGMTATDDGVFLASPVQTGGSDVAGFGVTPTGFGVTTTVDTSVHASCLRYAADAVMGHGVGPSVADRLDGAAVRARWALLGAAVVLVSVPLWRRRRRRGTA